MQQIAHILQLIWSKKWLIKRPESIMIPAFYFPGKLVGKGGEN